MDSRFGSRLANALKIVSKFGKSAAITQVQSMLIPHILNVFAEPNHEDLRNYIIVDYDLVEKDTPPGVRNALDNLGSNRELRSQWEHIVLQLITPENIKAWLRHPEEWLSVEEADRQRAELKRCADVIENTEGGEEWLEEQVLDLYRMANIVSQTAKAPRADD